MRERLVGAWSVFFALRDSSFDTSFIFFPQPEFLGNTSCPKKRHSDLDLQTIPIPQDDLTPPFPSAISSSSCLSRPVLPHLYSPILAVLATFLTVRQRHFIRPPLFLWVSLFGLLDVVQLLNLFIGSHVTQSNNDETPPSPHTAPTPTSSMPEQSTQPFSNLSNSPNDIRRQSRHRPPLPSPRHRRLEIQNRVGRCMKCRTAFYPGTGSGSVMYWLRCGHTLDAHCMDEAAQPGWQGKLSILAQGPLRFFSDTTALFRSHRTTIASSRTP